MGTYKITIAGLERELEFFPVSDKLDMQLLLCLAMLKLPKHLLKNC